MKKKLFCLATKDFDAACHSGREAVDRVGGLAFGGGFHGTVWHLLDGEAVGVKGFFEDAFAPRAYHIDKGGDATVREVEVVIGLESFVPYIVG